MKKLLLNNLGLCAAALALSVTLYAQGRSFEPTTFNRSVFVSAYFPAIAGELNPFYSATNAVPAADLSANKFSAKAVRNFDKDFKGAVNAKWSESKEGYTAFFESRGIISRVNYNTKGNWISTIRYYGEEQLPQAVRHEVKSTYYDYSIFGVTEVTVGDKIAYFVTLQDDNCFKRVKLMGDEMIEVETFKKAN